MSFDNREMILPIGVWSCQATVVLMMPKKAPLKRLYEDWVAARNRVREPQKMRSV